MANQINASLMHAHNENTLALANVTLDFSLFKIQPPVEFTGLGSSLSEQRRIMAEDGLAHQTARKLGALFEQIIPSTPLLIKAYGCRASEISKSSVANSPAGRKDGVFLQHAGADATSLWAAATSGASAISAHLLACMLARTWPGPEAVAIWVEIAAERTRMILTGAQQDAYNTPMGALFAARTGISRRELADWDASARAWLQIADDANQLQQKQLLLIIKNVSLPVNEMSGTFSSVTEAWSTAMSAVEKLLGGQPQSASKGAVLLGLASWSLYPDLLVLAEAPTPVLFKDDLFLAGGTLTIGLENSDHRNDDGVYWSLALSNLRYYGDPVVSKTSVASQASRISMEELHLLCLGSVLAGWGEEGSDIIAAAEFFVVLWERIQQATIDLKNPVHYVASEAGWLFMLVSASQSILDLKGQAQKTALSIVILGRRKAYRFLAELPNHPPPMFGLSALFVTNQLSQDPKYTYPDDVIMMRSVAQQLDLAPEDSLIRVITQSSWSRSKFSDFTTALPHRNCFHSESPSHRWWIESSFAVNSAGGRWRIEGSGTGKTRGSCDCHSTGKSCTSKTCPCFEAGLSCSAQCHYQEASENQPGMPKSSTNATQPSKLKFKCQNENEGCNCHGVIPTCDRGRCLCIDRGLSCTSRCHDISAKHGCGENCGQLCPAKKSSPGVTAYPCITTRLGEDVHVVKKGFVNIHEIKDFGHDLLSEHLNMAMSSREATETYMNETRFNKLTRAQALVGSQTYIRQNERTRTLCNQLCDGLYSQQSSDVKVPVLRVSTGQSGTVALFIRASGTVQQLGDRLNQMSTSATRAGNKPWTGVKRVTHMIRSQISPQRLLEYLSKLSTSSILTLPRFGESVEFVTFIFRNYMRSLEALSLATKSYRELGRATISIGIISRPLHQNRWVPPDSELLYDPSRRVLRRQHFFCCIAMLDSGYYDLSPTDFEDVMAISVRNTIYVSKTLLGDPFEASNQHRIALVIGNVGQSGMVLMVAPQAPRVRPPDLNHWREVTHAVFTGKLDDCFKATSLHLSFTEFILPLTASKKRRGAIDSDLKLVETLISAHDRGKWIGDLDVLSIYKENSYLLQRFEPFKACKHDKSTSYPHRLTSLDNWEEILDAPEDFGHENAGIVRASNNWLARIATACISVQLGHKTVVLPSEVTCWHCCCENDWKWRGEAIHHRSTDDFGDDPDTPRAMSPSRIVPSSTSGGDNSRGDSYDSDDESITSLDTHAVALALDQRKRPEIFIC
jgi:hypothetical protein